jgi:Xaa-Pro aminopeptidase
MADGLERCLAEMASRDLDALFLGRESNARFVSGATRLWLQGTRAFAPTCVVVRSTGAVHLLSITDAGVPATVPVERLYPTSWNPMRLVETVAAIDGVRDARRIGADGMTPLFEQLLAVALPHAELADGEAAMRAARRVKQPEEVDGIRAAVATAEDALGAALARLRPGVRERELVGVFAERMATLGTSTPAYEGTFCVVDGDGQVRRITSERKIADGDLVATSAGVLRDGWEGSLARTVVCGTASEEQRRRLAARAGERDALLATLVPGTRVGGVRAAIGPGRAYGIGLGYEGLADDDVLEPGMVVAVERAGGGLLDQDLVLVTAAAPELLTTFTTGANTA